MGCRADSTRTDHFNAGEKGHPRMRPRPEPTTHCCSLTMSTAGYGWTAHSSAGASAATTTSFGTRLFLLADAAGTWTAEMKIGEDGMAAARYIARVYLSRPQHIGYSVCVPPEPERAS